MNKYKKFARRFLGLELVIHRDCQPALLLWIADNHEPCIPETTGKNRYDLQGLFIHRTDYRTWILMDIALGILFFMSVFLSGLYRRKKIIKPFQQNGVV